jgi:photosystem II stability/assembly factor-like uncharacterized protein
MILTINKILGKEMSYYKIYKHFLVLLIFILILTDCIVPQSGWNFINPKPTGFTIWDIDKDNSGRLWIVGEYGSVFNTNLTSDWGKVDLATNTHFTGITFKEEKGWIIGTDGIIYQSKDSGQNWHLKNSGTSKILKQVQFLDKNVGWIIGVDSLILHTTDGGNNWNIDTLDYGLQTGAYAWPWNQVLFQTEEVGWLLVGYYFPGNLGIDPESGGALLKTTNGGDTWAILDSGDTKYSSIYFLNDSIGWLTTKSVNDGIRFFSTTNGGENWIFQGYTPEWREMYFIDVQIGWAISGPSIGKTTDGGLTWTIDEYMDPPSPGSVFKGLVIDNYSEGWCAGSSGFILNTTDGGNSWQHFDKRLDIYYGALEDVVFIDENEGWVVGNQLLGFPLDSTLILHTTDGGETWIRNQTNIDEGLNRIIATSDQNLWAFSSTILLKSSDGGQNWEINNLQPPSDIFRDIFLHDEFNCFVIAGRKIFRTQDGGDTWTTQGDFSVQFLRRIIFNDKLNGWLLGKSAGGSYPNYRTTDGGATWLQIQRDFTAINFVDSLVGYAIEDGKVHKTTNGGHTWWQVSQNPSAFANWTTNMSFVDEANGWTWDWFNVYNTKDSGKTWINSNNINKISNIFAGGLFMLSKDLGWAVGSNGYIFKFYTDSVSSVEDVDLVNPTEYILYQNYPNPFNPSTVIEYYIPTTSFVQLKIYDILGSEIVSLASGVKTAGKHSVKFNAEGLPSGIYLYRLTSKNFTETKKLIFLK